MYKPADMTVWRGRADDEETSPALRWHQKMQSWDQQCMLDNAITLIGFASDEGVRRNKGRTGARNGPRAIRVALANLSYDQDITLFDAGDVICTVQQLEQAQTNLAEVITKILQHNGFPMILGGGHEVAWGSFLGITEFLSQSDSSRRIGIVNFDAHLDLRNPEPQANSGTAFRQIAQWCESNDQPFNYLVFGINPCSNTTALLDYARQHQVIWHEDIDCTLGQLQSFKLELTNFLLQIDEIYLSICMDVFPASIAPGVSAQNAIGVDPLFVIHMIRILKELCKEQNVRIILADIAELNPQFDQEGITAKLASRLIYQIKSTLEK